MFNWSEQLRIANELRRLARKGDLYEIAIRILVSQPGDDLNFHSQAIIDLNLSHEESSEILNRITIKRK